MNDFTRAGIYDTDYFSGAQVAIYIGDVLVDEVTSISFQVTQSRTPLYGYASTLFDAVSEGNVLVQGNFSINFKEAGYLWLVLNKYKSLMNHGTTNSNNPFNSTKDGWFNKTNISVTTQEVINRHTIEQVMNGEVSPTNLMGQFAQEAALSLSGYSSHARQSGDIKSAENVFEAFENVVWGKAEDSKTTAIGELSFGPNDARRADSSILNPFDIFIVFGDFVGDDRLHHTVHKLEDVYILSSGKQITINGQPIQESYTFIAKNII